MTSPIFKSFYLSIPAILFSFLIGLSGCATSGKSTTQDSKNEKKVEVMTPDSSGTMSPYKLDRQVPNQINQEIPNSFYKAAEKGTRTFSGKPGPKYWQQWSHYDMDVELIPEKKKIVGQGTITYYNNSPDELNRLFLELSQNVHQEGVVRNEPAEITGGVNIESVRLQGDSLAHIEQQGQSGYTVDGTVMAVIPSQAVMPGDSVQIEISWNFTVPQKGAGGRMGYSKDNLFFIAYWYPQMRVYDDVNGWFTDPFRINAEFYHGFADYNVGITVPEQWVVAATGALNNADNVLQKPVHDRLLKAYKSDKVLNVIGKSDFGNVTQSGNNGKVTWNFTAEDVRDFAFSATTKSIWDATRTPVGDLDGDGQTDYTHIDAIYRSSAPLWKDAAKYSQHSIKFLSEFTSLEYPWPHMSAVEGGGIIGGGMEFPMMTLIGAYNGQPTQSLYAVIAHELAHMWVPMQVSTNERRYSWIDEGTTTFNEGEAKSDYYPQAQSFKKEDFQSYLQIAGTDYEGEMMRWSDYHYNGFAYGVASYPKPASLLLSLRGLLGKKTFKKAFQTFFENWQYKHPYPWDLFNTFEDVSGRDLDWFWRSWYYETWVLDQAVAEVTPTGEGTRIVIQDLGQVPMPSNIVVTLKNGKKIKHTINVQTWLRGATAAILTINEPSPVTKVEIDPGFQYPDVNRSNNIWQK